MSRRANPIPIEPPAKEKNRLARMSAARLSEEHAHASAEMNTGSREHRDIFNRRACWAIWEANRRGTSLSRAQNPVDMTLPGGYLARVYAPSGTSLLSQTVVQRERGESEDGLLLRLAKKSKKDQILELDNGTKVTRRVRITWHDGEYGYQPLEKTMRKAPTKKTETKKKAGSRKPNPRAKKSTVDYDRALNDADQALIRMMVGRVHVGTDESEIVEMFAKRKGFREHLDSRLVREAIEYALDAHYENYKEYVYVMQRRSLPKNRPTKGQQELRGKGETVVKTWRY